MSKAPYRKYIGNEHYTLTVFKVTKKFPNGTPRVCERVPEEGTVHLEGGEEFMTAYIPDVMLKPKERQNEQPDDGRTSGPP
jgi:hypothetical protein